MMIECFSFSGQATAFFWVSAILLLGHGRFHGVICCLDSVRLSFEHSFTTSCILIGVSSWRVALNGDMVATTRC
jgi:hypothetical protein